MAYFDPLPPRDERVFSLPPSKTEVLVVGLGPIGLVAALLLARQGISSTIVERHALRLGQPKAHAINPRSLEILRQAGVDVRALRKNGVSATHGDTVRFLTYLTGDEIGSLPYERQDEAVKTVTPEPLFNLAQPELEKASQEVVLESRKVTIHRRQDWQDYEFDTVKGVVRSRVRNRDNDDETIIESTLLFAADGTNSSVRSKMLGIKFESVDPTKGPMNYVSVHCSVDLEPFMKTRPAELFFFCAPETKHSGFIRYGNPNWVYARPVPDAAKEPLESFTKEKCKEEICTAIGQKWPCEIHSVQIWTTSPKIASSYSDESHRVFLAGDAAHTFPPMGGLGINTGIADCHNLVWKLKYVMDGLVSNARLLLNSYTSERKPVALANAVQSAVNETHMRQLDVEANIALEQARLDTTVKLSDLLAIPRVRDPIAQAIERNRDHFDSLGLQLSYCYENRPPAKASKELLREDCSKYEPSFRVDARLPHAWLDQSEARSTLGLVHETKFTLFTKHPDAACWIDDVKIPIEVIDAKDAFIPDDWIHDAKLDSSSLLVRPDQHILGPVNSKNDIVSCLRFYFDFKSKLVS